jgi:hypothetical protein
MDTKRDARVGEPTEPTEPAEPVAKTYENTGVQDLYPPVEDIEKPVKPGDQFTAILDPVYEAQMLAGGQLTIVSEGGGIGGDRPVRPGQGVPGQPPVISGPIGTPEPQPGGRKE